MPIYWMPCFLCKIKQDDFKGTGKLEIGENYNKFSKYKLDKCPLCNGVGRLAIKSYREKPWQKNRRNNL